MLTGHAQVVLKKPLPPLGLEPGEVGAVVNIYAQGTAYEVEFLTQDGHTIGLATIDAVDLQLADELPIYEPDDGSLTDKQLRALRNDAQRLLPQGKILSRDQLFS